MAKPEDKVDIAYRNKLQAFLKKHNHKNTLPMKNIGDVRDILCSIHKIDRNFYDSVVNS